MHREMASYDILGRLGLAHKAAEPKSQADQVKLVMYLQYILDLLEQREWARQRREEKRQGCRSEKDSLVQRECTHYNCI